MEMPWTSRDCAQASLKSLVRTHSKMRCSICGLLHDLRVSSSRFRLTLLRANALCCLKRCRRMSHARLNCLARFVCVKGSVTRASKRCCGAMLGCARSWLARSSLMNQDSRTLSMWRTDRDEPRVLRCCQGLVTLSVSARMLQQDARSWSSPSNARWMKARHAAGFLRRWHAAIRVIPKLCALRSSQQRLVQCHRQFLTKRAFMS